MTSLEWGAKAVVVACGWIAIGLMVTEPVPCAAQPQQSEQQRGQQLSGDNQKAAPAESGGKTKPVRTPSGAEPEPVGSLHLSVKEFGKDFVLDQKQIWTSPARVRSSDTEWLVPLAGISAGLFVTDRDVSQSLARESEDRQPLQHAVHCWDRGSGRRRGRDVAVELSLPQRTLAGNRTAGGRSRAQLLDSGGGVQVFVGTGTPFSRRRGRTLFSGRHVFSFRTQRRGVGGGGSHRARVSRPAAQTSGIRLGVDGQLLEDSGAPAFSFRCLHWRDSGQPDRAAGVQPPS